MRYSWIALLCCVFLFAGPGCDDSSGPTGQPAPTYDPGLVATYSTGAQVIESPIRHGWSADCDATGDNMYEGDCAEVDPSLVNWAWGDFSATWEGYIYVPTAGDYTFNSHFWVDGIVRIVIDDSVVADLDTPGGGYSKTLGLAGDTWYPISMSFTSNGGSNNMHLGWTRPGASWEIVPAENLGHR